MVKQMSWPRDTIIAVVSPMLHQITGTFTDQIQSLNVGNNNWMHVGAGTIAPDTFSLTTECKKLFCCLLIDQDV